MPQKTTINRQVSKQQKRLAQEVKQTNELKKEYKSNNRQVKKNAIKQEKMNFYSSLNNLKSTLLKGVPKTSQQTIPYKAMYQDGICRSTDTLYTKTIQFFDMNYQLAQMEVKDEIFQKYCDLLNYFDKDIQFQLTFVNETSEISDFSNTIYIKNKKDNYNDVRKEYRTMLKRQLERGNNGLQKTNYITFGIEAENLKRAKYKLSTIEAGINQNLKRLGVRYETLDGYGRLKLLYKLMNQSQTVSKKIAREQLRSGVTTDNKFNFNWNLLRETGLSTKDYISPTSFDFRNSKTLKIGDTFGAVSFIEITTPELTDRMLVDLMEIESNININMHMKAVDQQEAIKKIKRKITDLNAMKIEEQRKAVRSGFDMDILPPDLETFSIEAKNTLDDLQTKNEKMFVTTLIVFNTASTMERLNADLITTSGVAKKYNCVLRRLDFEQENGFVSSLPLGINKIQIERILTTSSTAIFIPFTTQELFMKDCLAIYYGLNTLSNNIILADRKKLLNPNGLILGSPGSGKSFFVKREIVNVMLVTNDDIIINDPEGEYKALVEQLGGQVVKVSLSSKDFINPMDISLNGPDGAIPIAEKTDFLFSFCELIVGEKLDPIVKTVIDRCLIRIYKDYIKNPKPKNMPILEDLYNELKSEKEEEAERIAGALELYVKGSLKIFNNRTNVNMRNRLICFDMKELPKHLKQIGMLIVQEQVWDRVAKNRLKSKDTRYYIDEFHLLLKEKQTATYAVEIWKRFRKWGGIPTGITQNAKDFDFSDEVKSIFDNSEFIVVFNQAQSDRAILEGMLKNIKKHQSMI